MTATGVVEEKENDIRSMLDHPVSIIQETVGTNTSVQLKIKEKNPASTPQRNNLFDRMMTGMRNLSSMKPYYENMTEEDFNRKLQNVNDFLKKYHTANNKKEFMELFKTQSQDGIPALDFQIKLIVLEFIKQLGLGWDNNDAKSKLAKLVNNICPALLYFHKHKEKFKKRSKQMVDKSKLLEVIDKCMGTNKNNNYASNKTTSKETINRSNLSTLMCNLKNSSFPDCLVKLKKDSRKIRVGEKLKEEVDLLITLMDSYINYLLDTQASIRTVALATSTEINKTANEILAVCDDEYNITERKTPKRKPEIKRTEERKALYKAVDSVIDTLKGLKDFDLLYITDDILGE